MGKTLIQQARGHGSMSHRVRRKAFSIYPHYVSNIQGELFVKKLVNSTGHSAPLAEIKSADGKITFVNIAAEGIYEGQKITFGGKNIGDIACLKDVEAGTYVFNIEVKPKDGGKFVRTGGSSALVTSKNENKVKVTLPSKQEREFDADCRVTIGVAAGAGRLDKPILKAGKMHFIKKSRNKLWPRTSAVKMNALDHPFGSGRGKRIKSKIAKNNSPPGAKVGHLHPRRTGRKKK
jgi:large subunit ribosomal protein L2